MILKLPILLHMKNPDKIFVNEIHEALVLQLNSILQLLDGLSTEEYRISLPVLSGSSIGAHIRHSIEMLKCLQEGYGTGYVNYEARQRDRSLETSTQSAADLISFLRDTLFLENKDMQLLADYTYSGSASCLYPTSYYRELAYCLEHSIHHLALVRVGMYAQGLAPLNPHIGIAPSTIRHENKHKN